MSQVNAEDTPTLISVAEQHGLALSDVEELLDKHEVDPDLLEDLLYLATVKFRTLDMWGEKTEYRRALEQRLAEGARQGQP